MSNIPIPISTGSRFAIERDTSAAEAMVFRFSGPFTEQNGHATMSPDIFRDILESVPGNNLPAVHILDLTEVPYMESRNLGMLVRYHARCEIRGIRLSIIGMSPRVQELFRITKMESVLPIAASTKSDRGETEPK